MLDRQSGTQSNLATMDVFLMVRRQKTTIFIDAKEDTTIQELKRMIAGIMKALPENQKLFKDREEMVDERTIGDYGLNAATAKPQHPATVGLTLRVDGEWEDLEIAPLSQPPELPEVMRTQELTASEQSV